MIGKYVTEEEGLFNVKNICRQKNYEFLKFCDKKGDTCEWLGSSKSYLYLHCKTCGKLWVTSYRSLLNNRGCPTCANINRKKKNTLPINIVLDKIQERCKEKNYEFLNFCNKNGNIKEYSSATDYLHLKCKKCNHEWKTTTYDNFISRQNGCPVCGKHFKRTQDEAMKDILDICAKLNLVFLGFCDSNGNDSSWGKQKETYLILKCKTCGNLWKTTNFDHFKKITKCPKCKKWSLEEAIKSILDVNNIQYTQQMKFSWLGLQTIDYYLPLQNIAIECQGRQHFKPSKLFGGEEEFQKVIERDNRKRKLCEENGIKLLYYSNLHIDYPYKVYEDLDEILQIIKEC